MTIIAYDGKSIAAERQLTSSGDIIMGFRRKLRRWKHGWYAGAGNTTSIGLFEHWLETGEVPRHTKKSFGAMFSRGRKVYIIDDDYVPWEACKADAVGNPREAAIALMQAGFTAKEAVKHCCKYDTTCGGKIDVVDIR